MAIAWLGAAEATGERASIPTNAVRAARPCGQKARMTMNEYSLAKIMPES
jgi:hypothetical protein